MSVNFGIGSGNLHSTSQIFSLLRDKSDKVVTFLFTEGNGIDCLYWVPLERLREKHSEFTPHGEEKEEIWEKWSEMEGAKQRVEATIKAIFFISFSSHAERWDA